MERKIDKVLLACTFALGALSLVTIAAANKNLALNQLVFWILGMAAFSAIVYFRGTSWHRYAQFFYIVSVVTLIGVFVIGESIRGSTRWIDVGVFRVQPSEIAKIATILSLGAFFVKRPAVKIFNLVLSLILITPPFVLIFIEPDIGSAAAILAIWAIMAFSAGMKKEHIAALTVSAILIVFLSFELLAPYQKSRIETFLNPQRDPLGAGYNIIQSKIAAGSGQIFGRGLGRGSQSQLNFLPEAQSDFIFASITEQLGFVGASLIIFLYAVIFIKMVEIAKDTDSASALIVVGTLALFAYQFTVNIGMNLAIIPVTGITLPFVSYGGSSLISSLILLAIVTSAKRKKYL